MHDNIKQISVHESGHALAYFLTNRPFSIVTIDPYHLAVHSDGKSLGYIQPITPYYHDKASYSSLTPDEFFQNFSEDVTIIAGYISQKIFSGTKGFDKTGSRTDLMALNNSRLINQPEPLRTAYKKFLIAYTFQLLSLNVHKQLILKIADELLEKKTLTYDQVQAIVDQYFGTE